MTEKKEEQDWDFTKISSELKTKKADIKSESQVNDTQLLARKQKKVNLELDDAIVPSAKSRSAMAKEIEDEEDHFVKNEFDFASPLKRAVAFTCDFILFAAVMFIVRLSSPLIEFLLEKSQLKGTISSSIIIGTISFIVFLFLMIIPLTFFNNSFGKKLMGISVRCNEKNSLTFAQALLRELILKPLSILMIVGFITPFFSKKKSSIHDMIAGTIVINN